MLFRRVNTVSLQQTLSMGCRWGQGPGHSNILGVRMRLGRLMGSNSSWVFCALGLLHHPVDGMESLPTYSKASKMLWAH